MINSDVNKMVMRSVTGMKIDKLAYSLFNPNSIDNLLENPKGTLIQWKFPDLDLGYRKKISQVSTNSSNNALLDRYQKQSSRVKRAYTFNTTAENVSMGNKANIGWYIKIVAESTANEMDALAKQMMKK